MNRNTILEEILEGFFEFYLKARIKFNLSNSTKLKANTENDESNHLIDDSIISIPENDIDNH